MTPISYRHGKKSSRPCLAFTLHTLTLCALFLATAFINPTLARNLIQLDTGKIRLGSVNALVYDIDNSRVLYSKNRNRMVPVASITKLMTAMVILDSKQPLDEWITIKKPTKKYKKNTYTRIRTGSRIQRRNLLLLALMSSENVASMVLSEAYPGGSDAFVKAMNVKARSLGMNKTQFTDPSGLSPENLSTPSDLLKMILAASGYPLIRQFSTTPKYDARFRTPRYVLYYANTNLLVRRGTWDLTLSKTGYLTEAGRCLVMVGKIDGHNIAMIFLDAFGKLTPVGDAGRVKKWITRGNSGKVIRAARQYERSKNGNS
ncbi:MAG: D-alanyl-D-alanine endopeptidase [Gammaproteobacteria bacterium]|nr:MAG: D-alanyl-D-alanine endopeptidase [Pseudomonadota bacterium]PIE38898.1 MAG: D-alanyl-D-alanine endopeptidase [Gammaproteobacteria bacterium]